MTSPDVQPQPPGPPGSPERRDGASVGLTAIVLVAISAAIIFWAGLTLGSQSPGRTAGERAAVEAFSETYRIISEQYIGSPAPEELLEGAMKGMFEVLDDPHSRYMSPDEFESALGDARGEFEGIGAVMATEDDAGEGCEPIDDTCRLRVKKVLVGAPAEAAGLQAGDVVIGVDGEPLAGSTIDDSVFLIRGPSGSDVTLLLERDGEARDLTITRDTVTSEDVRTATLAGGRVGYIGIDGFSARAAEDVETALAAHLEDGVGALIIDVRGNPGGFVDATVEISSQFLEGGPVFWEEDARGRQDAVEVIDGGLATDPALEVVVLVDSGTASASEILAGALQDAGRAQLLGERTFGKGTVQEWTELPGENGGFRLSVAKWLTRDKTWIDKVGVVPDQYVVDTGERFWAGDADADPALDHQLQVALELLLADSARATSSGSDLASSPAPAATSAAEPALGASPAA